MRRTFSNLSNLKKFAFDRDSYDNGRSSSSVEEYYEDRIPQDGMRIIAAEDEELSRQGVDPTEYMGRTLDRLTQLWERLHLSRMLSEADKYLEELPDNRLKWMYFGQIQMGVKCVEGKRKAYPLSPERDSCYDLLKRMFNWERY